VVYLFLKLNVWLCVMSGCLVAITAHVVGVPIESVGLGIAMPAFLFYFIYVEDRRSVSPEDWVNQPTRTAVVQAHSRGLLATEVLALFCYELLLVYYVLTSSGLSSWVIALGQVPFVVLAGYDWVKRAPLGDSLAVGTTWAYSVVFAFVVSTGATVSFDVVVVFVGWLLVVFAGVEARNIDDIDGDDDAEKPTLAGLLGPARATTLERALKLLVVVLFGVRFGPLAAGMVLGYLGVLWLCRRLTRQADGLFADMSSDDLVQEVTTRT
jgi:1,4-dihydroxy-2-naphthoate octaprenyltransferase